MPQQQKDERKAECPNCHEALLKIPGSKTKCPHCGKYMFVRTRPLDGVRLVVTGDEADRIDEDWTILAGAQDVIVAEKDEFEGEKKIMRAKFGGREPSDNDVKWSLLNKQIIENIKNGDWGLYRNTRFKMAEILRGEMKLKDAIQTYFEVFYLDLNGPSNSNSSKSRELLKEYPPFNPSDQGFLAPGTNEFIEPLVKRLKLSKDDLKKLFFEHNGNVEKSLKSPMSVDKAWGLLEKEIR
jgi:hypothetical protein